MLFRLVVLPRLESDLSDIMKKTISGTLQEEDLKWSAKQSLTVFTASGGYPESYEKGKIMVILEPKTELPVIVSRERGTEFKNWLDMG